MDNQATDSTQSDPKPELQLPNGDFKDFVQKELDQIQSIISRMAGNSFQCKGWAIGIVTIVLAITKDSFLLSSWQCLILLLPVIVFWYLDGFFLYTEQCYRALFNDVVKKRFYKQPGVESTDNLLDYNYTRYEDAQVRQKGFWTHIKVHRKSRAERKREIKNGVAEKDAPPKINTIFSAMLSKTLIPFYLLPILFVLLVTLKGIWNACYPAPKEAKDPVTIRIDSTTLIHIMKYPTQSSPAQ